MKSHKMMATMLLLCFALVAQAKVSVTGLKVENMVEPMGLGTAEPRFSWQTESDEQGVVQTGYELVVESDGKTLWNTGRIASGEQLWIAYRGKPLKSNQHCTWRVKVYTNRGATEWSGAERFSIGLLGETNWGGRWIGLERLMPGEAASTTHSRLAARYLRKTFAVNKPVRRGTAYVAGLGLYRFYVNGTEVGGTDVLKPVPSDYRKTIYYNTYDITSLCSVADSMTVGITLGNGKYFAPRQDKPYKNAVFGLPKCRMNIIVEYADGTSQRLVTDETWQVSADGPIRANNEYDGEEYDARLEPSNWQPAQRTSIPQGTLRAQPMPCMTSRDATPYRKVSPTGETTTFDFGQNMAGWVSFLPQGQAGDTIRVRYAERLNADGSLYVDNLRDARSEDIYICNGHDTEWHPSFVYHGFRYVEITGPAVNVKAWPIQDMMEETGRFECSDTKLNKVVTNARWGIRSNYKGLPVDCPQRNERQPWLGDRTMGALGESFLFGNERLYTKWMRDICEAQREDGCIPDVAPAFWNYYTDDVTWPAALPFICDMLWQQYGNDEALRLWYPNIRRWLHHIMDTYTSKDGLITKDKYGDWCMPPERLNLIHSEDPARKTDGTLIATAYTIRCLQLAEQFARQQDLPDDAGYWQKRREIMTADFNRRFLHVSMNSSQRPGHPLYPDSTFYDNNTATANLLPLAFGIVPDTLRQEVAKQVVENIIVGNKGHVSSGVIGISWLMRTLSDCGYPEVAWLLATQKTYPSWGYMAEQGATTIWELWNGDHANPAMNSANHVMLLGDLLTWCYQYLAGIRLPGSVCCDSIAAYRTITLAPAFAIDGCDWVKADYDTPYGHMKSHWRKTLQHLDWQVTIPCNTTAELHFPDGSVKTVGSGSYDFSVDIPTADPRIVKDEFLYEDAPFASPHASTIVETRKGELVAAYFGGTYERNPDCNIWVNIKGRDGRWSAPILAADGDGVACWNPVLTEMPDGELWLFYKVGVNVAGWTGWLTKSKDGGRTWGKPERLPEGFLGPIKNKPLLLGDRLLCGSSTEGHGWRFHVEIYNLKTKEWKYIGPIESTLAPPTLTPDTLTPIDCIQPSFLQLKDGRLQVLMRSRNGFLATSTSSDQGETWTPVTLTDIPNNQSGTDALTLRDGRHVLIYNNFQTIAGTKKGPRSPLSIAVSEDDGRSWQHVLTLEDSPVGEFSYPAIIQGRDGTLHCTYTWQRKRVAYKQVRLP
ncbi:MAG: family 78 glycoside hydrolase catalytic domain [Prevotella sp.]|nr:family 78 glycoside hydrolase catalytic domain [Prevotella sp.]